MLIQATSLYLSTLSLDRKTPELFYCKTFPKYHPNVFHLYFFLQLLNVLLQPTKSSLTGKAARANVRQRCKHCQELYTEQQNPRGACEYAPDPVKNGIATISCISCAQCMLYHCMSDAEGEFAQNPCR